MVMGVERQSHNLATLDANFIRHGWQCSSCVCSDAVSLPLETEVLADFVDPYSSLRGEQEVLTASLG